MTNAPGPRLLEPADLAAYQDDAIVSRVLLKGGTGNVTLFAFDVGQELSEHTAPFEALVHVLDGRAEVRIAGQPFELAAGQMIVLPADVPHALRAVEPFRMLLTMIRA